MWRLALGTLRFRTGGFIGALVAMALGTAMVMACGALMETGLRTTVPPQGLAAAAVVLVGDQSYHVPGTDESVLLPERVRIAADVVRLVEIVPGVADAVGDWAFPMTMVRDGQTVGADPGPVGHGWSSSTLAPYRIADGRAPVGSEEVAFDARLARRSGTSLGDRVDLVIRGVATSYRVVGIAVPPTPTMQAAVFFSDAQARLLSRHPNELDAIGVLGGAGSDTDGLQRRVESAVRGLPVETLTGDHRGLAEFPEARESGEILIVLSAVFGGMAILVAMLVVAGMLGLSSMLRQRELALLRAIGATPRQVRSMVVVETMIVAGLAIAVGYLPGAYLGRWLFARIAEHGVVSPALVYRRGWVPAAAAAGVVLLAGMTVAAVAGRRAARARPADALAQADLQRRWLTAGRLVLALILLCGGIALAIVTATVMKGPVAASTAAPTVIVFAMGLAVLGPGVTRLTTAVLRWFVRVVSGPAGHLAALNARARTVPMAAIVVPIMLATGMATGQLYLQTTQTRAAERGYTQGLRADIVLTSEAEGIPTGVVDAVREIPGVAAASEFDSSTGFVEVPHDDSQGDDGWPLLGISSNGAQQTMPLALDVGTLAALHGDSVAISIGHARALGRTVGGSITMRLGDGTREEFRIVALFRSRAGYDKIVMPADTLAAHTTSGLPSQILVRSSPGTDPDALIAPLTGIAARWPGIEVQDRGAVMAAFNQGQQGQAWVNYLLVGMIVAYAGLSLVNTLIIATGERRREFGVLRLIGATRGQVIRVLGLEATLAALSGILLGTLISATTLIPFSEAVSETPVPSGPIWIYLTIVAVAAALTVVSTLVPAWSLTRASPIEAAARG